MNDNKKIATQFLEMVVAGQVEEAYQKFVDMNGVHHNVHFPAGFSALQAAMQEGHEFFPHKILVIKNIIAEDDLVAVHSQITLKDGGLNRIVAHTFRIKDGKIVEMWDFGQEIPEDSPNTDGAF